MGGSGKVQGHIPGQGSRAGSQNAAKTETPGFGMATEAAATDSGELQVGEIVGSGRLGRSSAAARRGRRRRQQLGEVVAEVAGSSSSGQATTMSSSAPPRRHGCNAANSWRRTRPTPSWSSPTAQDIAWRSSNASPALARSRLRRASSLWLRRPRERERTWRPAGRSARIHARVPRLGARRSRGGEEEQGHRDRRRAGGW